MKEHLLAHAKQRLVSAARALIANQVGFALGCVRLERLLGELAGYCDISFPVFAEYVRETIALPLTTDRLEWDRIALREKDLLLDSINRKYYERVIDACWQIIDLFDPFPPPSTLSLRRDKGALATQPRRDATGSAASALQELQIWYRACCDGEWEHQYGVTIETLDNPGWTVRIDLTGTRLSEKGFDGVRIGTETDEEWIHCALVAQRFEIFCGAMRLETALRIFLDWAAAKV